MPQLDFLLNQQERIEFVKFVLQNGCQIIPNLHYNSNQYKIISSFEDYLKFCYESPLLFITSKKFSQYPLELDFFDQGGIKKFFIKQRHGGPTIDFFSPIIGEQENKIVGPGYLGIYTYYYHHENKFTPNKNIKDIYILFSSFIKKHSKEVKLTHRKYWVGKQLIKDASDGKVTLHPISGINLINFI